MRHCDIRRPTQLAMQSWHPKAQHRLKLQQVTSGSTMWHWFMDARHSQKKGQLRSGTTQRFSKLSRHWMSAAFDYNADLMMCLLI